MARAVADQPPPATAHAQQAAANNPWLAAIASAQDDAGPVAYLWPCNVPAWQAWQGVQTQWRVGMAGATGLDYAGVCAYLAELGLAPGSPERRDTFAGIQAAEAATLDVWAQRMADEAAKQT